MAKRAQLGWVFAPDSGGTKIPENVRTRTEQRIQKYAAENYAGKYARIDVRFRGALCYIDAYTEPAEPDPELLKMRKETRQQFMERMRNFPFHLVRLRYHGDENSWSLAFFTYSNEKYETSVFPNGSFEGTPEDAFAVGAMYLEE